MGKLYVDKVKDMPGGTAISTNRSKPGLADHNANTGTKILTAFLIIVGCINIFPFIFMVSSSFKPLNQIFEYPFRLIPGTFTMINYKGLFSEEYFFTRWYANTIVMVISTILLKSIVIIPAAYAFSRLKFRGRDKIFLVFLATLMIPGDVTLVPRYVVYKLLGITDSMWSLVLPNAFDIFFVFMLRQFFATIPFELTEAAIIDGCSHFKVLYRVILPNAKPAFLTMIIFTFIWGWNDYMGPYIFITDNKKQMLTVGIQMFQNGYAEDYGLQMAAAALAMVPVIILFLSAQKYFIEGVATSGIKG
ncbi:MAG: carbohydrate ABC transporter permease [Clostridiaceae bacterium]